MEACKIVQGQRYSKKLNDKQVTNILRATCQRPQQREQSICEMVLHNRYPEDKFAQEFGIKVCSDLVSVPARVLPPPMLRYHDSGREKTCAPSVGQWNMINKKMINRGTVDNWACLSFLCMHPEEVQRFCSDLIHMCNAAGMAFCPRSLLDIRSATPNNIENALRDVHKTTEMLSKQEKGRQLQLLIVILPGISGSYGKLKRSETDLGIILQCCLPRHARRPNKQYLENVALKINVKAPPSCIWNCQGKMLGYHVSPVAGDLLVKRQVEELAEELNGVKWHIEQMSSKLVQLDRAVHFCAERAYSSWKAGISTRLNKWWSSTPFITSGVILICGTIYLACLLIGYDSYSEICFSPSAAVCLIHLAFSAEHQYGFLQQC